MERDSFIFYRSFYEAIKEIPDEEQLIVYRAITEYALNGTEINIQGISKAIFTLVKPQIDANTKRYENGKKGGRKPKENQKETKLKPNVNDNVNVNDNDNVNVNNNDNVSDSCVDGLQEIINFYNENIGLITPYGIEILSDYAKEMQKDVVILAMKKSVEANKRTIQYIKAILNNWSKKGIKTILEVEQEDENFRKKSEIVNSEREKELEEWLNEYK